MMYSLDTSCFYTDEEVQIQTKLRGLKLEISALKQKQNKMEQEAAEQMTSGKLKLLTQQYDTLKEEFKILLQSNTSTRELRKESVKDSNLIAVFDSFLTRTLNINQDEITKDLFIVETYYFKVLEDLIKYGFIYEKHKYVCFTASAGQIRTKKTMFIKESVWERHHSTLMCGLDPEQINQRGGVNINKYLAYLALCNTATEPWPEFDIQKSIVVDDFVSPVQTTVDFIDDRTYEITRQDMEFPIVHTDGCGMILPRKSVKSMMVRLPWVKGLLVPFPFDKFIREHNREAKHAKYGRVTDIYGVEHDILKEKIEVIFTKSQFKMWAYYNSWEDYKEKFTRYGCEAAKCNEEEDKIKNAKLNYQMLQTLTDITDDELKDLAAKTIDTIQNIGSRKETMLGVLGVGEWNSNKNYYQQALEHYPELLRDTYSKEILKQVKKKITNNAKGGKIYIDGKYTFIVPDLYAFCEQLVLGEGEPRGLLADQEVSCSLYPDGEPLDCLRSPHLYREHAVRANKVNKDIGRWFVSKGIYTSCHDPISKILQFDNDGDKALVCREKKLVEVAKRNMEGIYPLYYEMRKAEPELISSESIYKGLEAAYSGGNIGTISNNISKIWNSGQADLEIVKILCMENNFTIDYAKTLYKPERPKQVAKQIQSYTKNKVPYFFTYVKDKTDGHVEERNESVVNRLGQLIPKVRLNFNAANLGYFDYRILMSGGSMDNEDLKTIVINEYTNQDQKKRFMEVVQMNGDWTGDNQYMYRLIREKLIQHGGDPRHVVDILVEYLYVHKQSSYKTTLWSCFGDIIVDNIKRNLRTDAQCQRCGARIEESGQRLKYCDSCRVEVQREKTRERVQKYRKKTV